jgi:hypothetical protein
VAVRVCVEMPQRCGKKQHVAPCAVAGVTIGVTGVTPGLAGDPQRRRPAAKSRGRRKSERSDFFTGTVGRSRLDYDRHFMAIGVRS